MLIALCLLRDHVKFDYITRGALISMFSFECGTLKVTQNMQTLITYSMIIYSLIVLIFFEPIVLIDFQKCEKFYWSQSIDLKVTVIQSWYK